MLRIRIEDHGPLAAFRWRGVPGEHAVHARLRGVAEKPELARGSPSRWGRKVLAARPPLPIEKRQSVRELIGAGRPHVARFGGSDVTGLDAFGILDAAADGRPGSVARMGVGSEAGPRDIVMRGGLLAGGAEGFGRVSEWLFRAAP
jgi:hypothetical protein